MAKSPSARKSSTGSKHSSPPSSPTNDAPVTRSQSKSPPSSPKEKTKPKGPMDLDRIPKKQSVDEKAAPAPKKKPAGKRQPAKEPTPPPLTAYEKRKQRETEEKRKERVAKGEKTKKLREEQKQRDEKKREDQKAIAAKSKAKWDQEHRVTKKATSAPAKTGRSQAAKVETFRSMVQNLIELMNDAGDEDLAKIIEDLQDVRKDLARLAKTGGGRKRPSRKVVESEDEDTDEE